MPLLKALAFYLIFNTPFVELLLQQKRINC